MSSGVSRIAIQSVGAHTDFVGIFTSRRKRRQTPTQFSMQDEKSGKSLFGFSYGSTSFIQLADRDGAEWRGGAIEEDEESTRYRFTNRAGEVMTGASQDGSILLRDAKGRSYKGVAE